MCSMNISPFCVCVCLCVHFTIPTSVDPENSCYIYSGEEGIVPSPTLQGRHFGWRGGIVEGPCARYLGTKKVQVSQPPLCRSNDRDAARRRGAWVETMRLSNCLPQNECVLCYLYTLYTNGKQGCRFGGLRREKKRQKKMDVVGGRVNIKIMSPKIGWFHSVLKSFDPYHTRGTNHNHGNGLHHI